MAPLSLLSAQVLAGRLTLRDALQENVSAIGTELGITLPGIPSSQVIVSSAGAELADKHLDLTYPRVSIFGSGIKNTQIEKFRALSGVVTLTAEIWASGDLMTQLETWIHCYVEGVAAVLRASTGDWGSGIYYQGGYEVLFQAPKVGGFGFVQSAKLVLGVGVSAN